MALEELFKNVTKRFNDDAPEEHEPVFKCPRCQQTTPESKFQELNKVCPHCNYHARLTAAERMRLTVDSGSFVEYAQCRSPAISGVCQKGGISPDHDGAERRCHHRRVHH